MSRMRRDRSRHRTDLLQSLQIIYDWIVAKMDYGNYDKSSQNIWGCYWDHLKFFLNGRRLQKYDK
jgi:hypothetical protein